MKATSEYKLTRKMLWDGDILKVQDTIHNAIQEVIKTCENAMEEEVLNHFECDFSDLREYMRDKIKWNQIQQEAIPHWIPVTERLPEVGEEVLIYAVGKTEDFSSVIDITNRMIFRLLPSSEEVETWSPPRQYFMTNYEITHWMPLPEPPKGEK